MKKVIGLCEYCKREIFEKEEIILNDLDDSDIHLYEMITIKDIEHWNKGNLYYNIYHSKCFNELIK